MINKYNIINGSLIWNKTVDLNPGYEYPSDIISHNSSTFFITGMTENPTEDIFLAKLTVHDDIENIISSSQTQIFPSLGIKSILISLSLLIGYFIYN